MSLAKVVYSKCNGVWPYESQNYHIGVMPSGIAYKLPVGEECEEDLFVSYSEFMSVEYEFNKPCTLPPVGCKLVIRVGENTMLAERTGYIADRNDAMEYKLMTGDIILGRFEWAYP